MREFRDFGSRKLLIVSYDQLLDANGWPEMGMHLGEVEWEMSRHASMENGGFKQNIIWD